MTGQATQGHPSDAGTGQSLAQRVAELAKGSPREKFRAWALIQECVYAQEDLKGFELTKQAQRDESRRDALVSRQEVACGDLAPRVIGDSGARLALLESAAEAGVPVAALRLAEVGPLGDPNNLVTRPDDPVVADWRKRVVGLIDLAARKGDQASLLSLSRQYGTGGGLAGKRDPARSLAYMVAVIDLRRAEQGQVPLSDSDAAYAQYTSGLDSTASQQAFTEGHAIAAAAMNTNGGDKK